MVVGTHRDPLKNFQFRLRLNAAGTQDGAPGASDYIAGVNRVSGLTVSIAPTEIWSGGNARHRHAHPDKCTWDAITLDQGLALDGTLAQWAQAAVDFATNGVANAAVPVKRSVTLDVWDPFRTDPPVETGGIVTTDTRPDKPMYRYLIHNAWISRYQAMPGLDAMSNEVALLSVELTHEGWRQLAVEEAPGPLDLPSRPELEPGAPDLVPLPGQGDTRFA